MFFTLLNMNVVGKVFCFSVLSDVGVFVPEVFRFLLSEGVCSLAS
jgi:hypothetical protein